MIAEIAMTAVVLCNNYNYSYSPGCQPAAFQQTINGWEGTLLNGEKFTQTYITKEVMLFRSESGNLKWLTYRDKVVYLNS